jgi:hypothetical protein
VDHSGPRPAAALAGVLDETERAARPAELVAESQHPPVGAFRVREPRESEDPAIELDALLAISRDRGEMMDAVEPQAGFLAFG